MSLQDPRSDKGWQAAKGKWPTCGAERAWGRRVLDRLPETETPHTSTCTLTAQEQGHRLGNKDTVVAAARAALCEGPAHAHASHGAVLRTQPSAGSEHTAGVQGGSTGPRRSGFKPQPCLGWTSALGKGDGVTGTQLGSPGISAAHAERHTCARAV